VADHFLTLTQQLAAKIEAVPGTVEALTAAEVDLRPFQSFSSEPELLRFSNDEVAEDQAQAPDFAGGHSMAIGLSCILSTSGVVGTAPAIGRYLRGCGMKEQAVQQITIGSISGGDAQFKAGETYSATGSKTGIIEQDISGAGALKYIVLTGGNLIAADVVTAGGDSATTSGSTTAYATLYTPRSTGQETLTVQRGEQIETDAAGQDYLYRVRGAHGTGSLEFNALDKIRANLRFTGIWDFTGAGDLFSGVTYEDNMPAPQFINAVLQIDGVDITTDQFVMDLGNEVSMDPDPSTVGGTAGYDRARIANRKPTITINPKRLKASVLDDLLKLKSGSTFAFRCVCGAAPQALEIVAAKCQIRAWAGGTRAGRETARLTLAICRHATVADKDYAIYFR